MSNNVEEFKQFGLKSKNPNITNISNNCVLYTRVSSASQKDNTSLSTQSVDGLKIIQHLGLNLIEQFGGISESASGIEDRTEYERMIAFVSQKSKKVGFIVVYDYSRLSREGVEGYKVVQDLFNKYGIKVITVQQGIADYSPSGQLHQGIQFMFNKFENDLRKEKCNLGAIRKMREGYTVRRAPFGYDHKRLNGEQVIEINKKGRAIGKAFKLKAERKYSNEKIIQLLYAEDDIKISHQRLSEIYKNPYYAGLIVDRRLDGEVIEGRHPKIVSKETFLLVNDIQSKNAKDYKQVKKNDEIPLRGTLCCEHCKKPLTGYLNKPKAKYYYKCNTKGCKMNISADKAHKELTNELGGFGINENDRELFVAQLSKVFNHFNAENIQKKKEIKRRIKDLEKKIDTLEEKMLFDDDKLREEMYAKHINKFTKQKQICIDEVQDLNIQLSNLDKFIGFSVQIALNLPKLWELADWDTRKRLTGLLFPNGLTYSKQNENYLTFETNIIFQLISTYSDNYKTEKANQQSASPFFSALVAPTGIEPVSRV